ncbi:MAG: putative DNA binding domain-containing protein [Pontiellaceae bacterium]|nr:putative DNA binding domain-containing protein [Pontiellaceae bacterium]
MMIDSLKMLQTLGWEESCDLEFKAAKGGLPRRLWETYSAMANTQGGVILLGVKDDGTIEGVPDPAKQKKDFWNTVNNRGKVSLNLLSDADVSEVPCEEKTLLAIRVPEATRYQKPVFIGMNPMGGTYRRNYEGDYVCSDSEVSRMMADASDQPADSKVLDQFGLDDIDTPSLQQYRQRLASHKPTHPWLSEDDKGLLAKLGGWRRDRITGAEGLTVAGLLMFGREESIREAVPSYHVDYREKMSDDPSVRWSDRLTMDGTWAGNLFQFYLKTIQRLFADLKLRFELDSDLFRKGETEVHEAIREALVNALIHADYRGQGGVIIEKYPDRFDFSNPGVLLVGMDQLFRGSVSECRNKSLQTMFMMIGGAEKAGSGIDKIYKGWKSQHWRYPMIRLHMNPDRVDWRLLMVSLIPDESLNRLQAMFGESTFSALGKEEVLALVTADAESCVDNLRMRQITGWHAADVTRLLQGLVGRGFLEQDGQGRWTKYQLPSSIHNGSSSIHNDSSSIHNDSSSIHNNSDAVHSVFHQIGVSESELAHLECIAASIKSCGRIRPEKMEAVIIELCMERYLTRRQLATLLDRNAAGLLSRYLTPMVRHGILQLKYPDTPNREDQAYTSAEYPAKLQD